MGWRNIYLDNHSYFFTSKIADGIAVLESRWAKETLLHLMDFYRERYKTRIQAYVIMPNHLHLIINSREGNNIKSFIQNLLRKSSIRIVANLEENLKRNADPLRCKRILQSFRDQAREPSKHAVWREKSRGVPIHTDKIMKIKLDYIHKNPLRAGLVKEPQDYLYSSFRNYYLNDHSIFRVDIIDVLNLRSH
jgi:REP element-mobilizing transposase RayT